MISRPPISVSAPPTPRESLQESQRISFLRILFFRELVKKTLKSKRCSFVCPHGGWVAGGPTRGWLGDPMTYGPRGDHFRSFQAPPLSSYFPPLSRSLHHLLSFLPFRFFDHRMSSTTMTHGSAGLCKGGGHKFFFTHPSSQETSLNIQIFKLAASEIDE